MGGWLVSGYLNYALGLIVHIRFGLKAIIFIKGGRSGFGRGCSLGIIGFGDLDWAKHDSW